MTNAPFSISCGSYHSLFLDPRGGIWSCGLNRHGQLGFGDIISRNQPQKNVHNNNLPEFECISAGGYNSGFLDTEGNVWVCGFFFWDLIDDDEQQTHTLRSTFPTKIPNLPSIKQVSCGGKIHAIFLDTAGCVWSCGNNQFGQLGVGEQITAKPPHKIQNLPEIQFITSGGYCSFFLDIFGRVWSCGGNQCGQLGLGDVITRFTPFMISNLPEIQYISCFRNHSLFLDRQGSVWVCGNNQYGQLGLSVQECTNRAVPVKIDNLPAIRLVACGYSHSLFLDRSGCVWVCGNNEYGQLGLSDNKNRFQPCKNLYLSEIEFISAGEYHSLFLDAEGGVWSCGYNEYGQLGHGDHLIRDKPVKIENIPEIICQQSGRFMKTKSARNM